MVEEIIDEDEEDPVETAFLKYDLYQGWEQFEKMATDLECTREESLERFLEYACDRYFFTNKNLLPLGRPCYHFVWNLIHSDNELQWNMPQLNLLQGICDKTIVPELRDERFGRTWKRIVKEMRKVVRNGGDHLQAFQKVVLDRKRPPPKCSQILEYLKIVRELGFGQKKYVEIEKRRLDAGIFGFETSFTGCEAILFTRHYRVFMAALSEVTRGMLPKLRRKDKFNILFRFLKAESDFYGLPRCGYFNWVVLYMKEKYPEWVPPYALRDQVSRPSLLKYFVEGNNDNYQKKEDREEEVEEEIEEDGDGAEEPVEEDSAEDGESSDSSEKRDRVQQKEGAQKEVLREKVQKIKVEAKKRRRRVKAGPKKDRVKVGRRKKPALRESEGDEEGADTQVEPGERESVVDGEGVGRAEERTKRKETERQNLKVKSSWRRMIRSKNR